MRECQVIKLWLPLPPTNNHLYPGKGRRFKSEEYNNWIKEAAKALQEQPIFSVNVPVQVTYLFGKPNNRTQDVFNREKALSDFLVKYGVLEDDSLIHRGIVEWDDKAGVQIEIIPYVKKAVFQD